MELYFIFENNSRKLLYSCDSQTFHNYLPSTTRPKSDQYHSKSRSKMVKNGPTPNLNSLLRLQYKVCQATLILIWKLFVHRGGNFPLVSSNTSSYHIIRYHYISCINFFQGSNSIICIIFTLPDWVSLARFHEFSVLWVWSLLETTQVPPR